MPEYFSSSFPTIRPGRMTDVSRSASSSSSKGPCSQGYRKFTIESIPARSISVSAFHCSTFNAPSVWLGRGDDGGWPVVVNVCRVRLLGGVRRNRNTADEAEKWPRTKSGELRTPRWPPKAPALQKNIRTGCLADSSTASARPRPNSLRTSYDQIHILLILLKDGRQRGHLRFSDRYRLPRDLVNGLDFVACVMEPTK